MKLQYLCHLTTMLIVLASMATRAAADPTRGDIPAHDYPTIARVEYVNECIEKNGAKLAALYQCACAIDRIANALPYDDFVEASTFAKYAGLPGQGGAIFRDSERGRKLAKSFRDLESDALRACGLAH
ncbi:MAG: hypothetical protein JWN43_2137 [Gammaproteobacteria bacterium]|nr:hypothetical protein [Gammaproteobacteria bacterium]